MQQKPPQKSPQSQEPGASDTLTGGGAVSFFQQHRRLTYWCGGILGVLLVCIISLVVATTVLMVNIEWWHGDIEEAASRALKQPVRFASIDASWQGIHPSITLERLTVTDAATDQPQLKLNRVDAVLAWRSVFVMEPRLARLEIHEPDLNVSRDAKGRFHVAGILIDPEDKKDSGFSRWVMRQAEIVIHDGRVYWLDEMRGNRGLAVSHINASLENSGAEHAFKVSALLEVSSVSNPSSLDLKGTVTMAEGQKTPDAVAVSLDSLDINLLEALVPHLPVDEALHRRLMGYRLGGTLLDVEASWNRQSSAWQMDLGFDKLVLREKADVLLKDEDRLLPKGLGVDGLTGHLTANQQGGTLTLDAADTVLLLPAYPADNPMVFDELKADVAWTLEGTSDLTVDIHDMTFRQKAMTGHVAGSYTRNPEEDNGGAGSLDLTAELEHLAVADVKHYIPLQTPKALADWLRAALKGGMVTKTTARIQGKIGEIPFPKGEGVFDIRAQLDNASINYMPFHKSLDGTRPLWPDLDHIQGEFRMEGKAITIHADTAATQGANLHDVDVVIPETLQGPPTLEITGYSDGPMKNQLDFVNASPVYEWIGHLTTNTTATGNGSVDIKIHLPLKHVEETTVDGHLKFQNNDIVLLEDLPVITGSHGTLHFTHNGFNLDNLKGQFLYEPVLVNGGTDPWNKKVFHVRATGTLGDVGVQKTYRTGAMQHLAGTLTGKTPFAVDIRDSGIEISTSLKGLGIALPYPLGKGRDSAAPLQVTLKDLPSVGTTRYDQLSVMYGGNRYARYIRRKKPSDHYWQVEKGGFGINRPVIDREGLMINASIDVFSLDSWIDFIVGFYRHAAASPASGKSSGGGLLQYLEPHWFNLAANRFHAFGLVAHGMNGHGSRHNGRWDITASSDLVDGQIVYIENSRTHPNGFLQAKLKNFDVGWHNISKGDKSSSEPLEYAGSLPSMDVETDNLGLLDRHELGHAILKADSLVLPRGNAWAIRKLHLDNAESVLEATGEWTALPGESPMTQIDFSLNVSNQGEMLKRLLFDGLIEGGESTYSGHLYWLGLPFVPDFPSLGGNLSLTSKQGEVLMIKPGAAKLLSALGVKAIARRATGDLHGVGGEGFAYDMVSSDFVIEDGVMRTENMKVNGLLADVDITGIITIPDMTQDLTAVVKPELDATGGSILVGLLNPVVGVGTLLAQWIAKAPLTEAFTYHFHISGHWGAPVVQPMAK